jgi:hypothetical protein
MTALDKSILYFAMLMLGTLMAAQVPHPIRQHWTLKDRVEEAAYLPI